MSDWGGTDAESLKNAIDSIFSEKGSVPLNDYKTKLVSATTDGTSVNTGRKSGLLVRLERDGQRPWLLKIHCANHRIELAVSAAFKDSVFNEIDWFYTQNFSLLKNSGLLKSQVKSAGTASPKSPEPDLSSTGDVHFNAY